jgi:hypothetical protein
MAGNDPKDTDAAIMDERPLSSIADRYYGVVKFKLNYFL